MCARLASITLCLALLLLSSSGTASAQDLQLTGSFSWEISSSAGKVSFRLDGSITNPRAVQAGPMYLELRLIGTDGESVVTLAEAPHLDPLAPGASHVNVRYDSLPFYGYPQPGTYTARLILFVQCAPSTYCSNATLVQSTAVRLPAETLAATASNYSDIWWTPAESGWGLTIADHETQLFAVWYTYRQDGSPTWFVISGGTFSQNRRIFAGDVYQTTGPRYDGAFNPGAVTVTRVGTMSIDFAPPGLAAGTALFTYTIGTVSGSKQIQRQPFGNAPPEWGADVTDIWWNPDESGWGLTLAQHGNNVFGVWFTYDTSGQPLFVVLPGVSFSGSDSFSGPIYTTRGPYFGGPFDPARVQVALAGNATVDSQTFAGQRRLRFRPVIFGSAVDKQVQRQPFGNAPPNEPQAPSYALGVTITGTGTGRVISNPAGIDCPGKCSATYTQGTVVTLTATATGTSKFVQFTGTCSSTAPSCAVTMGSAATVSARFDLLQPASTLAIRAESLPPFVPGVAYSELAATASDGQPPYAFSLDSLANGAPPIGMNIDLNGRLVGTPNINTTQDLFTFSVCVQDAAATRVCTATSVRRQATQPPVSGTCRGTGTITVSGQLRDPGQPFCRGALPLTSQIQVQIEMQAWNVLGQQQAVVTVDKGLWICQNDRATGVSQLFAPVINLSAGAGGAVSGVGTSSDSAGRFDISFTMNGALVNGTFSRTYIQSNDATVNWSWTGNFSCSR